MATLQQQFANYKSRLKQKLVEGAVELENEMHRIVAIDTGALNESITTGPVKDLGNALQVDVGSEGIFYAIFVEKGVKNRVARYHRRQGGSRNVVWVGVGQQWAERSLQAKASIIVNKLRSARGL